MPIYQFVLLLVLAISSHTATGTDYFVHPEYGKDYHTGKSREQALKTLERASKIDLLPGDRLLLASGETYLGGLNLIGQHGNPDQPIQVTTALWDDQIELRPAKINFKGAANGILLAGSSYIEVSNIQLSGNGYHQDATEDYKMRCGVLITNKPGEEARGIKLNELTITDVYFENPGFTRGKEEVRTANGTQRYGWGIRVINKDPKSLLSSVSIENCRVENVAHTGIKLTGKAKNIQEVYLRGNEVIKTGGPGIQMSGVQDVYVSNNTVSHSGSNDDSRKWGRGSGLWTWGSSRVLIEKNSFLHANGPGDSAGAHIDFNCDNIILQYNLSAYNAGGFCEVLGNTYNCAYRYNVSINDGFRKKGVDGAFQEGKVFWLSGYQGKARKRKGPVNFYFYNNTIFCDSALVAKIAIDKTSRGVLIANNIFYLQGGSEAVLGDQYKADTEKDDLIQDLIFENNLFLDRASWSSGIGIKDSKPVFGDPGFKKGAIGDVGNYVPKNASLLKKRGTLISLLPTDSVGLWQPLHLRKDILNQPIKNRPSIGAIEPVE